MPTADGSTPGASISLSYAARQSRRLSSRDTTSRRHSERTWPRRSKTRQTQPSAATVRARPRYCSWLPPQPCRKSTPGAAAAGGSGVSSVPSMSSSSTGISTLRSRWDIRLRQGVLDQGAEALIDAVVMDDGAGRRLQVRAVTLDAPGSHGGQGGVGAEGLQGGDLRPAAAADAPRRLKHAAAPASVCVAASGDVVVAPRGEEAGELLRGGVVDARLGDGQAKRLSRTET